MILHLLGLLAVLPLITVSCTPLPAYNGAVSLTDTTVINYETDPNALSSGFAIENCEDSERYKLIFGLIYAKKWIQAAIDDMSNPKQGRLPYQAFFKDDTVENTVEDVLLSIRDARTREHILPDITKPYPPTFLCATEDMQRRYPLDPDPWVQCQDATAETIPGFRFIILCPDFWDLPLKPGITGEDGCPDVVKNRFTDNTPDIVYNQPLLLAHEMVHFYLAENSLDSHTYPAEVYALNHCVGLNAVDSSRNPTNYQAYIACKSLGWSILLKLSSNGVFSSGAKFLLQSPRSSKTTFLTPFGL